MPLIHEGNLDFAITQAPNGIVDAAQRIKSTAPITRHMTVLALPAPVGKESQLLHAAGARCVGIVEVVGHHPAR